MTQLHGCVANNEDEIITRITIDSPDEPTPTPETPLSIADFIWLSPAEKAAIPNTKQAIKQALFRGQDLAFEYFYPGHLSFSNGRRKPEFKFKPWIVSKKEKEENEEFEDEDEEEEDEYGFGEKKRKTMFQGYVEMDKETLSKVEELKAATLSLNAARVDTENGEKKSVAERIKEHERIKQLLEKAGIHEIRKSRANRFSKCVMAGLVRGHFGFEFTGSPKQLEYRVTGFYCENCNKTVSPTIRTLLYQDDYAGTDYEEGGENAAAKCKKCGYGEYLTRMCCGMGQWDSGKFHNHCTECIGLGSCINDYRNAHCRECGLHYFQGNSGFPCKCRKLFKLFKKVDRGDRVALAALCFYDEYGIDCEDEDDDDDSEEEERSSKSKKNKGRYVKAVIKDSNDSDDDWEDIDEEDMDECD
ncbi:hypothetical protein HDU79_009040 [Rhizoclosmatium sp. JEL0117]|nr:hypothetical protein HDU79_009040 [Rhizoclosmatium sp. JEL0117]